MVSVSRSPGPPHTGHVAVQEPLVEAQGRLTGRSELDIVGGDDGQLVVGHGNGTVLRAVDDRDRTPPEPLAGQQPVTQAEVDLAGADAFGLEPLDGLGLGLGHAQPVEPFAVDGHAVTDVGLVAPILWGLDGANDRQPVGPGEIPVALVLAGHGHDGAGAVGHQDVVGQVDGHRVAGERIDGVGAGEDASLVEAAFGRQAVDVARQPGGSDEPFDLDDVLGGGDLECQWVFGGQHGIRHPEAGVGPGGVHLETVFAALDLHGELERLRSGRSSCAA